MKIGRAYALVAGALLLAAIPVVVTAQGAATEVSEEQAEATAIAKLEALEQSLHPQFGRIAIPAAKASLDLGKDYYFIGAEEARRVLTEGWGNPPDAATGVLGMVFPKGKTFNDLTWGAVLQYEETGHIEDKDAAEEDYDAVLESMRESAEEANPALVEQGYPASHVIGWAQAPTYDAKSKTLIWARNLKFDGTKENTLNYDVRTLGRTGVLSLNMVDSMSNLALVRAAASGLGATVEFDQGTRYADFNPSTDKVAEYGLAGLIAAGAGVAVAKKLGILGILLLFLKKGFVVIAVAGAGIVAWFKRKFGRGYAQAEDESWDETYPAENPAPEIAQAELDEEDPGKPA